MSEVQFDYTRQDASGASCTAHAWAKVPAPLTPAQRDDLKQRAAALLKARNAVLVAHYYVDGDLQDLALETGGCVADSLEMARFGRDHAAQTLVVAGVRFMGESAKILSPDKTVLMPDLDATCSLDLGCPPDDFAAFCDAHPDRQVVVYANTSQLIATSPTGTAWTLRTTPSASLPQLRSVEWFGSRFVAVGDAGTILVSGTAPAAGRRPGTGGRARWSRRAPSRQPSAPRRRREAQGVLRGGISCARGVPRKTF